MCATWEVPGVPPVEKHSGQWNIYEESTGDRRTNVLKQIKLQLTNSMVLPQV